MSDDPATDQAQQPSAEPPFPEAPPVDPDAAPSAAPAADAAAAEEVEYVYQDENGNPIAAPEGGFNPDEYEVVETEAPAAAEGAPAAAPAADPELVAATTQKLARPVSSSRRTGDRKSGRQPKPMTPEELKKVRTRVILVLGLLAMIPILGIALLVMLWWKGHIKFGTKKPAVRMVDNDFSQGEKIFIAASPHYKKANALYEENKRADAYAEYKLCEKEYTQALDTIRKWSDGRDLTEYRDQDLCIRQIQMELRHVRERIFQIEQSGDTGAPKPPPPPAP